MEATIQKAIDLQRKLHRIPEASGCERETKKTLIGFLNAESDLEIIDRGKWFYADGKPFHGCGHDGHSSVMAALAASVKGKKLGKNLFFLFQHAEETGAGGAECCEIFDREKIDAIYGFHNCPGFPAGTVLLLHDTFACASKGLILRFEGSQTHAAHPENGRNPIFPMAAFFEGWQTLTDPQNYGGPVLATPVCFTAGSRSFGVAAGSGEIDLTLRAWYDADLEKLVRLCTETAGKLSDEAGIRLSVSEQDVFPATRNAPALYEKVKTAAQEAGLSTLTPAEPFRWSEDFGRYSARCPAFFCGIGAGEDANGLHTPDYRWHDEVTDAAIRLFSALIRQQNQSI